MKTMMILLCLCFSIAWAPLSDQVLTAQCHADGDYWQGTSITVQAGDVIRICANGTWISGKWKGDANGRLREPGYPDFRLPGAPCYSLIGQIGSQTFFVGTNNFIRVETGGELKLCMNDVPGIYWDNSGTLNVSFEVYN